MTYYHLHCKQQGFSLVETLVAVSILLIVIIGPMTISMSTARSTSFSSEQVVAFFLAQEGAELAQKARDQYILDHFLPVSHANYRSNPWQNFTDITAAGEYASCYQSVGCGLELIDGNVNGELVSPPTGCANGACRLYFDSSGGRARYTHTATGNEATEYTRTLRFTPFAVGAAANDDVRVISEVTWYSGAFRQQQSVKVETHLFNVYGTP